MIQKIVQSGNPTLREVSKPVIKIDKKVKKLITDLKDTLAIQKDPEGVGLASPQIGVNLRVFVINYKNFKRTVINPEIVSISKKKYISENKKKNSEILEGCLSLPHYYGPLKREQSVTLKYQDEEGKEITEEFKDFNAQMMLHEIDHLNGVLFVDRLLEQKKKLYHLHEDDTWEEVEIWQIKN